jgi:hypothetical protein
VSSSLVAIVIPVYKEQLTDTEILSLKQCLKVLKNYQLIFIAPHNISIAKCLYYCEGTDFQVVNFEDEYFKNIAGYNRLMLSAGFYKTFLKYKYILIYQFDAYVFRDELTYWCRQNYDYIGAPHISHMNQPGEMQFLKNYDRFLSALKKVLPIKHQISNVGNGGLSLRKTRSCYWLLKLLKSKVEQWGTNNEDGFFKYWGNILYPLFRLPSDETALKFSIETEPASALQQLQGKLPFGCHAFEKYDWETWKPYILNQ